MPAPPTIMLLRSIPTIAAGLALVANSAAPAFAAPVPRQEPTAGSVVSVRTGEEIDFVEAPVWQGVEVLQDVKAGDVVRTNALGQLAILFNDQTQVRVARNSTLVVKSLGEGDTQLALTRGSIFARAARGGTGVTVETPAAAAAIRGTDWSMTVEGDRTSLVVLEGEVEFFNPQGSITVREGEAAAATLGQAPTRVVIVDSDDREQMLVHLSLRGAFGALSSTDVPERHLRQERARLAALPVAGWTAEDRVAAAEAALAFEPRPAVRQAVATARQVPLSRSQEARLLAVEATLAGSEARYDEAARLYRAALPGLQGGQRTIAEYQLYFARALADPSFSEAPPRSGGATRQGLYGDVIIAAFLEGPVAALELLQRHEPRYGNDASYQAAIADLAMLAARWDVAKAAIDKALLIDPGSIEARASRASYRASITSDLEGAYEDLRAAVAASPGSSSYWNMLGLLQDERGAAREAEAAHLKAIETEPEDPVNRANYAILLLDQGRVEEAKAQIDKAIALDPGFDVVLFALGRYQLQAGETEQAIESILAATTANPGYQNGLLMLAVAHYISGEREQADQSLEIADRLDRNDPVVSQYRAIIAIDDYRADDAVRFARESVERTRARGGDYASVAATRESGTTVGDAFRFVGLDAWARFYGDQVFDPFRAGGYFDQAITGSPNSFAVGRDEIGIGIDPTFNTDGLSSLVQGLLLDPLAIAASHLRPNLLRIPFLEAQVTGGFIHEDGDWGGTFGGEVQGLSYSPIPVAGYVTGTYEETERFYAEQPEASWQATAMLGAQLTPHDRVVAFATGGEGEGGLSVPGDAASFTNRRDGSSFTGVLGWSHTFAHRNVLDAAVFASRSSSDISYRTADPYFGLFPALLRDDGEEQTTIGAVSHAIGVGDVTFRYGAEGGRIEIDRLSELFDVPPTAPYRYAVTEAEFDVAQVHVGALAELSDQVKFEAALFGSQIEGSQTIRIEDLLLGSAVSTDEIDQTRLDPRVGAAWTPVDGHWLRAGYLVDTNLPYSSSLAPVGVVGLQASQAPISTGGRAESAIARWDAEWTEHLFTAVEYQHQELETLSIGVPGRVTSLDIAEGELDRLSLTANIWIPGGIGLFGTFVAQSSENETRGVYYGDDIPFVPETAARFGLTWTHPSRVRVTLAENYLGARQGDLAGTRLDGVWTTDLAASWESENRRFFAELRILNLFDEEFVAAPILFSDISGVQVSPEVPGTGRAVMGKLSVRF